jgi:hypothetical protein
LWLLNKAELFSLTVYKKDEPEFPISIKKGFRFFLWNNNFKGDWVFMLNLLNKEYTERMNFDEINNH